jgi:hypothetical protein
VHQPLRRPVGDAGDDHAAVALSGQDDIVEVFVPEQVEDVLDVGLEARLRGRQVNALGVAGQRRREDLVAAGA